MLFVPAGLSAHGFQDIFAVNVGGSTTPGTDSGAGPAGAAADAATAGRSDNPLLRVYTIPVIVGAPVLLLVLTSCAGICIVRRSVQVPPAQPEKETPEKLFRIHLNSD